MRHPDDTESEARELRHLLEALFRAYGIDFRSYAYASIKRRVMTCVVREDLGSIGELERRVLAEPATMERLLTALTVHVTAMFRDPAFYRAVREKIVPLLRTYSFVRFWVAGCSTGEEVYSLAILLHEAGLYPRCRIYATDLNDIVLANAKAGIFPLAAMRDYTQNYQKSGGQRGFAEYYTTDHEFAVFRPFLRDNVVFAAHNLAGDASFNEFHVIFCRNVMIYFNRDLQGRVHQLFHQSLLTYGFLGLGRSETVRFSPVENCYQEVAARERLYRKVR